MAALSLLWTGVPSSRLARAGLALAAVCMILQLVWIGPHWQVAPLYLALLLVMLVVLYGSRYPRLMVRLSGTLVVLLVAAACAFSYVLPMFELPQPTGAYPIGTSVLYMVDTSRKEVHTHPPGPRRELMVQVWYPAAKSHAPLARYRRWRETTLVSSYMAVLKTHARLDAPVAAGGAFPVILFDPAWKGQRTQSTAQMEDLASHGFVVAAIDHPYNSQIIAFPDGRRMDAHNAPDIPETDVPLATQIAEDNAEADYQAEDTIFVLDQLAAMNRDAGSRFYGRIDTEHAGAYGHSFGGSAAMEAARRDPRIRGAINLDGWIFGDVADKGLPKPFLYISNDEQDPTAEQVKTMSGMARMYGELTVRDAVNMQRMNETHGSLLVEIHGANHVNFSDRVFYSPLRRLTYAGKLDSMRASQIIEAYIRAFFLEQLQGKPEPMLSGSDNPFPEARCTVFRPANVASR
jgi:predicted dienelactone hydrolase